MNLSEYKRMEKFEKTYWWHKGRFYLLDKLIRKYLPNKENLNLFEIGCGTGETLNFLSTYGEVSGIDISPEAINFCRQKGQTNVFLGNIVKIDMQDHKNKYDVVLALDVLEHIQNDVEAMRRANEMLTDDGVFILTVPAHKFLWSGHDEALHHKRRYHSVELKQKLKDAGLSIEKYSSFVTTAFFPILLFRLWGNLYKKSAYPKTSYVELPEFLNKLAINILKIETKIFQLIGLPVGTTLVAVLKKSNENHKN